MKRLGLIALCLLCGLYSCKNGVGSKRMSRDVHYTEVGVRTIPMFQTYVGQVYGLSDIDILSRVDGWLTGIHFKEGTHITKGQLLYTIDDLPIKTKISAAKASLAEANSRLVKSKADYDRVKPLAEMNALSKRELDNAFATLEAAKAEVKMAKAQLKNCEIELGYTRITAPISGLIGMSRLHVGDYVSRGLGASQALNTISEIQQIRVKFAVSENNYLEFRRAIKAKGDKMKENIPMSLILNDGSVYPETGRLDIIDREINPTTGAILVQAIFDNKDNFLRPGQYVKVSIKTGQLDSAIIVPQSTVNQMQNIYQVFILNKDNKLEARIVEVGERIGTNWVIKKGLTAGERVATLGNLSILKADAPVNAIDMKWNYDETPNSAQ